jgi:hypothetical protein
VFDKMSVRKYFVKTERSLLRWDVDDSNNTMGAFLRLVLIDFEFAQKGAPNVLWQD